MINDPIGFVDPLGLQESCGVVTGSRISKCGSSYASALMFVGNFELASSVQHREDKNGGGWEWEPGKPATEEEAQKWISKYGGWFEGEWGNLKWVPYESSVKLAQNVIIPGELYPPANDATAAQGCERAGRKCVAKSRMLPDPYVAQEYLQACVWVVNACMERAWDPNLKTTDIIWFPDGTGILIKPGGLITYIDSRQSRPRK